MTVFHDSIRAGLNAAYSVAGKTVVFRCLATNATVSLTAIVGRTDFQIETDYGITTRETRDFIVPSSSLVFDGNLYVPVRGDRIIEVIGDVEYTWEAYNPAQTEVYYYTDQEHEYMRIHTQMVDAN
jgi:hypothetical protein